ncbi:hypothetical protein Krac_1510 [Ktedonobacter racemifer DSM 44963]|uniref:Uncharacterized protein n=1 Tax=Ktedonobacter racemifer DSM 44963 TaxID=485913 RepID=D6U1Z4_KTERA|nr:hypothetical protein Krac_1510 [Ktedonobacter racemifer DSM 44963]
MPCPTTLSDMPRLPGMLGPLWVSPLGMPVTQELLPSSSCLRQEYHNAPHGAHPAGHFHGTVALQNSLPRCAKILWPIQANLCR